MSLQQEISTKNESIEFYDPELHYFFLSFIDFFYIPFEVYGITYRLREIDKMILIQYVSARLTKMENLGDEYGIEHYVKLKKFMIKNIDSVWCYRGS